MRLSTRGRFAITAMIDLAMRESSQPVPLQDIALRHRISLSYLEQVFAKLRQHGLVESTRGPGGGYTLGFRGDAITVADIVAAIEEPATASAERDGAQDMTKELWAALQTTIVAHMKTITLKSLAAEQRAKGVQVQERKPVKKGVLQNPSPPWCAPRRLTRCLRWRRLCAFKAQPLQHLKNRHAAQHGGDKHQNAAVPQSQRHQGRTRAKPRQPPAHTKQPAADQQTRVNRRGSRQQQRPAQ